jgi:hypothetical protein
MLLSVKAGLAARQMNRPIPAHRAAPSLATLPKPEPTSFSTGILLQLVSLQTRRSKKAKEITCLAQSVIQSVTAAAVAASASL